jgi:hypothetical protein
VPIALRHFDCGETKGSQMAGNATARFGHFQVRLTRDLQITRSHRHATNAVYPPAPPHGVFVWIGLNPTEVMSPELTNRCGVPILYVIHV